MTFSLKHALLAGACLTLAGCATAGPLDPSQLFSSEKKVEDKKNEGKSTAMGLPTDIDSAVAQAQKKRKDGDLPGASRMLSQLVLVAPDDPRVLGEYGKTLVAQGRSDDALAFLERAIELQPSDWTLFSAQGVAYDQKGIYQAAENSYGRALVLRPGEPSVLSNSALSHMQAGDLDGAERLLLQAQAIQDSGTSERIASNLALVKSIREKGQTKSETLVGQVPQTPPPTADATVPRQPFAETTPSPRQLPAPPAVAESVVEPAAPRAASDATASPDAGVVANDAGPALDPAPHTAQTDSSAVTAASTASNPPAIETAPLAPLDQYGAEQPAQTAQGQEPPNANEAREADASATAQLKPDRAVVAQKAPKETRKPQRKPARSSSTIAAAKTKPTAKPANEPTKTATADVATPAASSASFLRPSSGK